MVGVPTDAMVRTPPTKLKVDVQWASALGAIRIVVETGCDTDTRSGIYDGLTDRLGQRGA